MSTLTGIANAAAIEAAAAEVGVDLALAAALAEQESNGRMVYGHDAGGVFSTFAGPVTIDGVTYAQGANIPVTAANYAEFYRRVVGGGERSNGVGIMQITYRGFLAAANTRGVDLADPLDNVRFGLGLVAGYLRQAPAGVDPVVYAASVYNRGEWAGPYWYTDQLLAKLAAWRARLVPPTVTVSAASLADLRTVVGRVEDYFDTRTRGIKGTILADIDRVRVLVEGLGA